MNITKPLLAVSITLLLGACAPAPERAPRYEPAPSYEPAPQPAASLHDRVHSALRQQMGDASSGITVRVDGSTVYLGGHVGSQSDHDRAHDVAHRVPGVSKVIHKDLVVH